MIHEKQVPYFNGSSYNNTCGKDMVIGMLLQSEICVLALAIHIMNFYLCTCLWVPPKQSVRDYDRSITFDYEEADLKTLFAAA